MRMRIEWQQELDNLRELGENVPDSNASGEDNHEAIRAQINVIENMTHQEDIFDMYEGDEFILNAALDAERWLRHDDEAPSELWKHEMLAAA